MEVEVLGTGHAGCKSAIALNCRGVGRAGVCTSMASG